MIAADDDRRPDAPASHQVVERQPGLRAFTVPQPADARGEPLKRHPRLRQADPARQRVVAGKQLEHRAIRLRDIARLARQRDPSKRPLALTEQRPDVGLDESRIAKRVAEPRRLRLTAQVIAVVEHDAAEPLQRHHRLAVPDDGGPGARDVILRLLLAHLGRLFGGHTLRDVAAQGVVGRRLIGDDVEHDAAPRQLGVHRRRISQQRDGLRPAGPFRLVD